MPSMGTRQSRWLNKERPDLIILDLGLPAGDGFVVLDRLQKDDKLSAIPVIVLTARDPQANERRVLRAGAADSFRSRQIMRASGCDSGKPEPLGTGTVLPS